MKISIMQPTYLPWIGYFDLIDQSDVFVFLDTVQFEKQSWQHRNRIKVQDELHWLSVPVIRSGKSKQAISEVEIIHSDVFHRKHLSSIEQNYSKAPYFNKYFPSLRAILESGEKKLSKFNESIIVWMAQSLGINTRFTRSSALNATGRRSELLVSICREVGSKDYLSTPGSVHYLDQDSVIFDDGGVTISVQQYNHPNYRQTTSHFIPFATTLDLMFNEGDHSLEIIRSGRTPAIPLQEAVNLMTCLL